MIISKSISKKRENTSSSNQLLEEYLSLEKESIIVEPSESQITSNQPLKSEGFYSCIALIVESKIYNSSFRKEGALFHIFGEDFNHFHRHTILELALPHLNNSYVHEYLKKQTPEAIDISDRLNIQNGRNILKIKDIARILSTRNNPECLKGTIISGDKCLELNRNSIIYKMEELGIKIEQQIRLKHKIWEIIYDPTPSLAYIASETTINNKTQKIINKYELFQK